VPLMGEAGSTYNTMWAGLEACLCTKWHVDPSSRLAGPKIGGSAPWGNWVRIKHNVALAEAYLCTSGILIHPDVWSQQTWAEDWGGCVPFLEGIWIPI